MKHVLPTILAGSLLLSIATTAIAGATIEIRLQNGSRWTGELQERIELTYRQRGVEIETTATLVRTAEYFITVETEVAGEIRRKTIYKDDIIRLSTIRGADDAVMDINLRGNFHMARAVIPHMRKQESGAIVCVSSIAGRVGGGVFGTTHYAAAKSGIFGLAKGLARELAPDGIRANAIAPGPIDNDFTHGKMTDEMKAELAGKVPLGRIGQPRDIANACLFFASDESAYITGDRLNVVGGRYIV